MAVYEAPNIPPLRKANKAEIAEWFEVSIPAVDGWIRRGMPYVQKGSKGVPWVFDLRAVAQWRFGGASSNSDEEIDPDRLSPCDRKAWYESEKARLAVETTSGHLCEAADVERQMHALIAPVARMLETLPDILERDASLTPAQMDLLQNLIDAERQRCADIIGALE